MIFWCEKFGVKFGFWGGLWCGLTLTPGAIAQPQTVGQLSATPTQLGDDLQITVTTTRTPRQLLAAPGTVTLFDRENLERNPGANLRDILRYEPGLSVQQSPRAGLRNLNIRGLEGARVLLQIDGIRLPNEFNLGPFGTGRDFVDLGTLRRMEVLRGPGSSLYGSDALGGVVTFSTLEPSDFLGDRDRYARLDTGGSSADSSFTNALTVAARADRLEFVGRYGRRDFREPNRLGDVLFRDRQAGGSNSYFGKLVYRIDERQTLKLTADVLNRATNTFFAPANLRSETGGATVLSLFSGLSANRSRVSLDYDWNNPEGSFRSLRAQLYYQNTQTPETTLEERWVTPAGSPPGTPASQLARRDGFNNFLDRIVGGNLQLSHAFTTGELNHTLTYGVDLSAQRNERPRRRVQTNLVTGAQTQNNIPDNFPTKDFPDSDTYRVGIYLQDEIEWGDVSIIPGLRFDTYGLATTTDADFFRNASPPPANFSATSFSPRLAVVWKLSPELRLFGQYARGFRAPLYDEINSGFANTLSGYFVAPNPDLKAETSDGFELGLRGNFPQGRFSIAAFYNNYSNFIERFANTGTQVLPGFTRPFLRFQSRNAASARIYGLEASGEYRFQPGNEGFSLLASLGFAVGDDLTADRPLNTINPFKAVAGLRYRGAEERWGAELIGSFVGTPRAPGDTPLLIPDGYVTVDLLGFVQFSPQVRLNVGVFNLFNTQYFEYADLRNFAAADRFRVDSLAQPGVNFSANLSWQF